MVARNNNGTVALVTWAQSQLAAVGINVTLDIQEDAVALPRFKAIASGGEKPSAMAAISVDASVRYVD